MAKKPYLEKAAKAANEHNAIIDDLSQEIAEEKLKINKIKEEIDQEDRLYYNRVKAVAELIAEQYCHKQYYASNKSPDIYIEGDLLYTKINLQQGGISRHISADNARQLLKEALPDCSDIDALKITPVSKKKGPNTLMIPESHSDFDNAFAITADDAFDAVAKAALLKKNTQELLNKTNKNDFSYFCATSDKFELNSFKTGLEFTAEEIQYVKDKALFFRCGEKPNEAVTSSTLTPPAPTHRKGKEH